jgi:hypothetical protein
MKKNSSTPEMTTPTGRVVGASSAYQAVVGLDVGDRTEPLFLSWLVAWVGRGFRTESSRGHVSRGAGCQFHATISHPDPTQSPPAASTPSRTIRNQATDARPATSS